jgi:hypothetical protein
VDSVSPHPTKHLCNFISYNVRFITYTRLYHSKSNPNYSSGRKLISEIRTAVLFGNSPSGYVLNVSRTVADVSDTKQRSRMDTRSASDYTVLPHTHGNSSSLATNVTLTKCYDLRNVTERT